MTTTNNETVPALYCGTYAKYNNGSINGKWLKLGDYADATEFWTACEQLHADESDPEFMFQDFEGFPKSLYNESMNTPDIEKIIEYAKLDEDDRTLVDEYEDAMGSLPDDLETARDSYETELESFNHEREYGEYVVEQGLFEVDMNSPIATYIDYESLGRDCLMDCSVSSNGYVFRDN